MNNKNNNRRRIKFIDLTCEGIPLLFDCLFSALSPLRSRLRFWVGYSPPSFLVLKFTLQEWIRGGGFPVSSHVYASSI